jgi:hypothetical protein
MFQGDRDADRWVRWSLERLKTKKKTTKTDFKVDVSKILQGTTAAAESKADVQGTGPVKRKTQQRAD